MLTTNLRVLKHIFAQKLEIIGDALTPQKLWKYIDLTNIGDAKHPQVVRPWLNIILVLVMSSTCLPPSHHPHLHQEAPKQCLKMFKNLYNTGPKNIL